MWDLQPVLGGLSSNIGLIAFLVALAIYVIGAFLVIYHLIRFGVGNAPKVVALVFFVGSAILLLITTVLFITLTR